MTDRCPLLNGCLYFTANALARAVTRLAEEAFRPTGLTPSHAFLLMVVADHPGLVQKDLARELELAPSTVTRFVDALAARGLVARRADGKAQLVDLTPEGRALLPAIAAAWKDLYDRYTAVIGRTEGDELAVRLDAAVRALEA